MSLPIKPELVPIGARIRDACQRTGFKYAELARRIGVDTTTMNRYLSGRTKPGSNVVVAIAEACGVTAEWIMTGKGDAVYGSSREYVEADLEGRQEAQMEDLAVERKLPTCLIRFLASGRGAPVSDEETAWLHGWSYSTGTPTTDQLFRALMEYRGMVTRPVRRVREKPVEADNEARTERLKEEGYTVVKGKKRKGRPAKS